MNSPLFRLKFLDSWLIVNLSAVIGFVAPASAQSFPVPSPVVADSSLGTRVSANTFESARTITIDGGAFSGPAGNPNQNLFHSFTSFSLDRNDVAFWTQSSIANPLAVRNIVNRVTGGVRSSIDGQFNSASFPNADLFFINPAGVVFGNNFSVSVSKSLFVSTAHELRFTDGARFVATSARGSTLSMSSPESFGFAPGASGDISFANITGLGEIGLPLKFLAGGNQAHFSAANIGLSRDVTISDAMVRLIATGATPAIVSVLASAEVSGYQGDVKLTDASLNLGGTLTSFIDSRAALKVGAGRFALSGTEFARSPSVIQSLSGGDFLFDVSQFSTTGATGIGSVNFVDSRSPRISVRATGDIVIAGSHPGSIARLGTFSGSSGVTPGNAAIDLVSTGGAVTLDQSRTQLGTTGAGAAGSLLIDASKIDIANSGIVTSANGLTGAQRGGDVSIKGGSVGFSLVELRTFSVGGAVAGNIFLGGDTILVRSSTIASEALTGSGGAGRITIAAERSLEINDSLTASDGRRFSNIFSATSSNAPSQSSMAGSVSLSGETVNLSGSRNRAVDDNDINGRVRIAAQTAGSQTAGPISIRSEGVLDLTNTDVIGFSASGPELLATGSSGNVDLSGQTINLTGSAVAAASSSAGNAGNISIIAGGTVDILGESRVSATSSGSGSAGDILLQFGTLAQIGPSSFLSSDLDGPAASAGNIVVRSPSGRLVIKGNGPNGESGIGSSASGPSAAGGSIEIAVADLILSDGGIRASAINGSGGQITVRTSNLELREGAFIATNSRAGSAGDINILLPSDSIVRLSGDLTVPRIATSSTERSGGRIFIQSPFAIISRGSAIEALGPDRLATATLSPQFRILGYDRRNFIDVAGAVFIQGQNEDVSRGTQIERPTFTDAYRVLVARCQQATASGTVSALSVSLSATPCG